jgi:hypothetical protein
MEPQYYIISNHQYYPDFGLDDWTGPYTHTQAFEKFNFTQYVRGDILMSLVEVRGNKITIIDDKRI